MLEIASRGRGSWQGMAPPHKHECRRGPHENTSRAEWRGRKIGDSQLCPRGEKRALGQSRLSPIFRRFSLQVFHGQGLHRACELGYEDYYSHAGGGGG